MTAATIMAGFGYIVLFCLAVYVTKLTWGAVRLSMGFTGKLSGEVYVIGIIALILWALCYFLFPFQLTMSMLPVGVK